MTITISQSELLYVGIYEFPELAKDGVVSVLRPTGEFLLNITIPGVPQISGICFSK